MKIKECLIFVSNLQQSKKNNETYTTTFMKATIEKSSDRGHANYGWLNANYSFSFANYYNPQRMGFGSLRVLNDDTIAPSQGFDTHPHKNMEVITIPLKGLLRHGDSLENTHVITRGEIQLMSTGTGIFHSEFNGSNSENAELLQIWIVPNKLNTTPKYENHDIKPLLKKNELSTFIAPNTAISILQDAWFSWGSLDKEIHKEYHLKGKFTGVYVFVISGEVKIGETILIQRDAMGIEDIDSFTIEALQNTEILLIEVAM